MINKWNFQTPTEEELHKRDALAAEIGFIPVICLLLVQRGITTAEEARKFFKPNLNDLHDPFLMPDMDKAVKRLNRALGNKEKILVYGDYDVDGTTAVSLVYKYLRPYSSTLDYYIPVWTATYLTDMTKGTVFLIKGLIMPPTTESH